MTLLGESIGVDLEVWEAGPCRADIVCRDPVT